MISITDPLPDLLERTGLDDDLAYCTPFGPDCGLPRQARPYQIPGEVTFSWDVTEQLALIGCLFEIPARGISEKHIREVRYLEPGDAYEVVATIG